MQSAAQEPDGDSKESSEEVSEAPADESSENKTAESDDDIAFDDL